jgi:hypothetical protein
MSCIVASKNDVCTSGCRFVAKHIFRNQTRIDSSSQETNRVGRYCFFAKAKEAVVCSRGVLNGILIQDLFDTLEQLVLLANCSGIVFVNTHSVCALNGVHFKSVNSEFLCCGLHCLIRGRLAGIIKGWSATASARLRKDE